MHTVEDCIFCKIVAGEIPSTRVYEDDYVIAFDDINKQAPVHTLVVPKEHVMNLTDPDLTPELLGHIMSAINKVAEIKGVTESGYRVIQNNGPDASQTVLHLHFHILGGTAFAEGMV